MNRATFEVEIITACFCAGAEPEKQAEIRAASIRGQLRWWFRVLGGFKSLAHKSLEQQESAIFGAAADGSSSAGSLTVRVSGLVPRPDPRNDVRMEATIRDCGYFLFPLRTEGNGTTHDRSAFNADMDAVGPTFNLDILWRGDPKIISDLQSLITVFAHLGSLGFRGRRAMGALAPKTGDFTTLQSAREKFSTPQNILLFCLPATTGSNAIDALAKWLKKWRAHGRARFPGRARPPEPPHNIGFKWALRDHDEGYEVAAGRRPGTRADGKTPNGNPGDTFRPALGLPIDQVTRVGKVNWFPHWDATKAAQNRAYKGEGRFASPILLRPHKDSEGNWQALVIFVEKLKWNKGDPVFLNGSRKTVQLDLYEIMKTDRALTAFP